MVENGASLSIQPIFQKETIVFKYRVGTQAPYLPSPHIVIHSPRQPVFGINECSTPEKQSYARVFEKKKGEKGKKREPSAPRLKEDRYRVRITRSKYSIECSSSSKCEGVALSVGSQHQGQGCSGTTAD
jgi:hypothetical protein